MVATQAQTVQVTCINKPNRGSSHEAITYLGGSSWRWTRAQVVQAIENQTNAFFTNAGGTRAWLVVRRGVNGKYVQTESDGKLTNNLLSLPEC
jgi:hypothetical protein